VPIDLWEELQSEMETAYLLKSETMKKRLLDAKYLKKGIRFDEACKKLGDRLPKTKKAPDPTADGW